MERPFEVAHKLFPYQSNWCEVGGIPIHYIDEGDGPVLLLLHGNFMWSFSYRRLIETLSRSYRCISIDLAGMGMSGKPHALNRGDFRYTYLEQSLVVERVIAFLHLNDITFLSFDHGGPIGFSVMVRNPEWFSRIVIANSWAWSCHTYRASNIWSSVSPLSKWALRKFMLRKERWLFEEKPELANPDVWHACISPYPKSVDFSPIAGLARDLTRAKTHLEELEEKLQCLAGKEIKIVWSTRTGGLFPEFTREDLFLARWRKIYPNASVRLTADVGYYSLVTRPAELLVDTLKEEWKGHRVSAGK